MSIYFGAPALLEHTGHENKVSDVRFSGVNEFETREKRANAFALLRVRLIAAASMSATVVAWGKPDGARDEHAMPQISPLRRA